MKKHFAALLVLLLSCLPVAQAQVLETYEDLEEWVMMANADLPLKTGPSMELTSMEIGPTEMVWRYKLAPMLDLQQIPELKDFEQAVVVQLSSTKQQLRPIFSALIRLNMNLRLVYSLGLQQVTREIMLTPATLSRVLTEEYSAAELLDNLISTNNMGLPLTMADGLVMKRMEKQGDKVNYVFEINENYYAPSLMEQQVSAVRESISQILCHDLASISQMRTMTLAGFGMRYVYVGNRSGKMVHIDFTRSELQDMINRYDALHPDAMDIDEEFDEIEIDSVAVDSCYEE